MRIAFISYEFPPDTALGGIATYVFQAARTLAARGHSIEVFTASATAERCYEVDGVLVRRVLHASPNGFAAAVLPAFQMRHVECKFDVVEGPEFNAEASDIIKMFPHLALVVRLHTPTYLVRRLSAARVSFVKKWRIQYGAYRRRLQLADSPFHPSTIQERMHTMSADLIVSPSQSLANIISGDWGIAVKSIRVIPNQFVPNKSFLEIPPGGDTGVVAYLGRLETRKGVEDLAAAIPSVLRAVPHARFRFIGRPMASPEHGILMDEYLRIMLGSCSKQVEFVGGVPNDQIPRLLADVQVCVFPSRWENFPTVCLEAMAAGRAIIGTRQTGFAEQLGHGEAGWLVAPGRSYELSGAIVRALQSPVRCRELGALARDRLIRMYSAEAVCPLQEAGYRDAIERRRKLGVLRPPNGV